MAHLSFDNFSKGINRSKIPSNGSNGTLYDLVNGHINKNGEIEKRKGFYEVGEFPSGCFGLHSCNGSIYTFGTANYDNTDMPSGVIYQKLTHPTGAEMKRILSADNFLGKVYVVAEYQDGNVYHFYDGSIVVYWRDFTEPELRKINNNNQLASFLASKIDSIVGIVCTAYDNYVEIESTTPGVGFTHSANVGASTTNSIDLMWEQPNIVGNDGGVAAVCSFVVDSGSSGVANYISSIKLDGQEVLGSSIQHTGDAIETAEKIVVQITDFGSGFFAWNVGANVLIRAWEKSASWNGKTLAITTNAGFTVSGVLNFSGGADAIVPQRQIVQYQINGSFSNSTIYQFIINGNTYQKDADIDAKGDFVKTFKRKIHTVNQSLTYFSAVNDATFWTPNDLDTPGAGFIDLSSDGIGSDKLTSIGVMDNYLAFFTQNSIQLWQIDVDPEQNSLVQTIENIGTSWPLTTKTYGSDILFLSSSGVRSIKARINTNLANTNDIGYPIDNLIKEKLEILPEVRREIVRSIIDPSEGRYWLCFDDEIFVYSYFPESGVAAWSRYELDFFLDDIATNNGSVFIKTYDDRLVKYGGSRGTYYDDSEMRVLTPFSFAESPVNEKQIVSFDASIVGEFEVNILIDPKNTDKKVKIGTITEETFKTPKITCSGRANHLAVEFKTTSEEMAKLAYCLVEFK